jgi:hypothetical protein
MPEDKESQNFTAADAAKWMAAELQEKGQLPQRYAAVAIKHCIS